MNLQEFERNRAAFPDEVLSQYQGCWVAFGGDGRRILASGENLEQVENQLAAVGVDRQTVFLEHVGTGEDDVGLIT